MYTHKRELEFGEGIRRVLSCTFLVLVLLLDWHMMFFQFFCFFLRGVRV